MAVDVCGYDQFYEPEVVDTPKSVDFDGTVSILTAATKYGELQVNRSNVGVLSSTCSITDAITSHVVGDRARSCIVAGRALGKKGKGERTYRIVGFNTIPEGGTCSYGLVSVDPLWQ